MVLLALGLLQVTNAWAQDVVWIGQPSVGEFLSFNVQKGLQQYAQLRQSMAQFESQITAARSAYFTAPAARRAAAGIELGKWLFQKDVLIAWPRIVSSGDQEKLMSNLIMLGNGARPVDGGVPPSAAKAFDAWIRAVRVSAGSAGGMYGTNADPSTATAALLSSASEKEYEIYRRLRDQAELDDWNSKGGSAGRKLVEPGRTISATAYFGENPSMPRFDWEVKQLSTSVLRCVYGGRQAEGSVYYFWQGQPPGSIGTLLALNPSGLSRVKDHAVDACPANSSAAQAIESTRQRTVVTSDMARQASAARYSVPHDPPAGVQGIAATSRSANDRMAAAKERKAEFQACAATFQAARYVHDSAVLAAARKQYSACMRNALNGGAAH